MPGVTYLKSLNRSLVLDTGRRSDLIVLIEGEGGTRASLQGFMVFSVALYILTVTVITATLKRTGPQGRTGPSAVPSLVGGRDLI